MAEVILTQEELADRWNLAVGTIENWRKQRKGPAYVKLGKGPSARVRYRLSDVESYEAKNLKGEK